MEPMVLVLGAVALIVACAVFSRRTGIASPLILLLVGIAISYTPVVPDLEVDPEWILAGVLPPLLYSAAVNVPVMDLRRNLKPIAGLSVTLVLITSVATGYVIYWLIPDLDLAASIALGAVISPTDAVAATSIGKRLGLPSRLVTVLEGESLVNDASALVLLRSAVAATAGSVSLLAVAGDFLYAVAAAVAVGLVIGWVSVTVRARLNDPVLTTTVSFIVPFLAFIPAEEIGASGVLAVVVAGLVTGHRGARQLAATERISEHTNWMTVQFVLEHGVFLLMGLEIRGLVQEASNEGGGLDQAVLIGLLLTVMVVVLRFAFVIPQMALVRRDERRQLGRQEFLDQARAKIEAYAPQDDRMARRKSRAQRGIAQRSADLAFVEKQGLSLKGSVIIGWAGMRGVVTLAAAQSLPSDIPNRAFLILVAFTVAVVTLLGLGGSLPLVIRLSKIQGDDRDVHRTEVRSLLQQANDAALAVLDDPEGTSIDGVAIAPEVVEHVRKNHSRVGEVATKKPDPRRADARTQQIVLERRMLEAARNELLDARAIGAHSSKAIQKAQSVFDVEEYRLDRMSRKA